MVWWVVMQVLSTLIEWIRIGRLPEQEKDLEILVLRKQLAMVEQQLEKPVRLSRAERLTLAVIRVKLKASRGGRSSNCAKSFAWCSRKRSSNGIASWYDANGL
jgi:hypothetical protein